DIYIGIGDERRQVWRRRLVDVSPIRDGPNAMVPRTDPVGRVWDAVAAFTPGAQQQVPAPAEQIGAEGEVCAVFCIVAVSSLPAPDIYFKASEFLVEDEVHHTSYRVRAIGRRGAAGDHVDTF